MTEFRVISPEQAYAETLDYVREIDEEIGTRICDVLRTAVSIDPRLSTIDIYPYDNDEEKEFNLPPSPSLLTSENLGLMQVRFNAEKDYTLLLGEEGALRSRFLPHKQCVIKSMGTVSNASILDICVAHEIGHAAFLYHLADKYGEDTVGSRYDHHDIKDVLTLPFGIPSSEALEYWQNNRGGYRSYLEKVGYDQDKFLAKLDDNVKAYNRLPMEAVADGFALDVIRHVYKAA